MDFVVKLGETGSAFPYTHIPPTEKVAYLQEKIFADTKIEIKDQILFTKKGHKLHADDVFGNLEKENNFQTTIGKGADLMKSVFAIYVFDKKKFSDEHKNAAKDKSQAYFNDNNEDLKDYLTESKIIDKDYASSFQSQVADSATLENIKKVNPDIAAIDNKAFGSYLRIKKKFLQYKSKVKKVEKLVKESENQLQTFDVLLKHASINYNPAKHRKNDVQKRFLQNQEKNSVTLKKFEGSLENLKKIELHDSLKTDKQKFLCDIYFSPEAMYKWRNSCIEFQSNIKGKIDKYSSIIKAIKKKLKDERDQTLNGVLNQFNSQASGVESAAQEGEAKMVSILKKCYEDYRSIRETLESFSQSPASGEDKLNNSKWKELDSKNWDEEANAFDEYIQKMDKYLDQFLKMKSNFENHIFTFYRFIMKCAGEFNMIANEKMKQINDEIDKMEKEFAYLLNPSLLPTAYQASLVEVSRRREFATTFDKKLKKLQFLTDSEKDLRKKFLAQFGRILPCEFIPQLKHMPPTINVENPDADNTLPKIEGFYKSDSSKSTTDEDPERAREKKDKKYIDDLERLNREYKQEIQKLKDGTDVSMLRRKLEELAKEFDSEKERNKGLKVKLNEMERQSLNKSLRREITKEDDSKEQEYQSLREEFEQLTKLSNGVLGSLENFPDGHSKLSKENLSSQGGEKVLNQRITVLTSLVQQVSKSSFDIFSKKLGEKQKKYDEARMRYENLLMKAEEDLQRQGTQISGQYEEKVHDLNQKYSESQKKIAALLEEAKKYQREISELKNDVKEKEKDIDQAKKDIKIKLDMLKSKDEVIKQLSEGRNAQAKQISEFKEKMEQFEQKIKLEHSQVLTNIHNLHKADMEKLKEKIKVLETSAANKVIEMEKVKSSLTSEQKERKQREEICQKLESDVERLNGKLEEVQKDLQNAQNKADNMEIVIKNKGTEMDDKDKKVKDLTAEKKALNDELSAYKQFNSEMTKNLLDLKKKKEAEKNELKAESEKLALELEKKKVEINNLNEQMEKANKKTKEQLDEMSKLAENQNVEKTRLTSLTEELNQKNIEINTLQTKLDLLSLDLENKKKEHAHLTERLEYLKQDNEKLGNDVLTSSDALAAERNTVRDLKHKLEDVTTVGEQFKIEAEIEKKKRVELEKSVKELNEKVSKGEESLSKLKKENELMKKQNSDRETRGETEVQELKESIAELEKEIAKKNEEIESLTSSRQETQEELAKVREQCDYNTRCLKEKEESLQGLKEEIRNNQNIASEFEKQEVWYKEEIKAKQQNIDKLGEQNETLTQEFEKINGEHRILTSELATQKEHRESEVQQHKHELCSKMDYLRMEKGTKVLFIPYSSGIYVPFVLHQFSAKEIESILKNGVANLGEEVFNKAEKSVKANFFLDLEGLSPAYQDILKNFSLLVVGTVKNVKRKVNKEINPNQESLMVEIEKVDYMMGFDDEEEMLLKNYAE